MKSPFVIAILLALLCLAPAWAQVNDSPAGAYQWKRGKTEFQPGYVVLRSGKRMEGKISLIGSATALTEVEFMGDQKYLTFPVGSLQSFGLLNVNPNATAEAGGVPVNDSPERMYEWRSMGVVMGKEIESTVPRAGYAVARNGTRYEGELKLRRKDRVLQDIEVKTASGKEKLEAAEVARYGYTVSEDEVTQAKLAREQNNKRAFPGSITTTAGKMPGEITLLREVGVRNLDRILFKGTDGLLAEHSPASIMAFAFVNKGEETAYTVKENVFVPQRFDGNTFQLYLNPNPTTINEIATGLAKAAMNVGTTATATAIVKEDQKRNHYVSNMDSVIRVSSTGQLIELRDKLAAMAGYETAQDAINNSDNESLKANISALELVIQGRQASASPGGILNVEWVIYNKRTREKFIVYKSQYKDQIDVLLMGCEKYLVLGKPVQNDMQKWDNLAKTVAFLDGCY
ncbi:MAG: hypothetical protein MUC38_03545 [Cyclobacteriaceae bacterium]|jgi:hypothetical protein|nr:hypothetical protein [Cyclobacteriaceae bacterium]